MQFPAVKLPTTMLVILSLLIGICQFNMAYGNPKSTGPNTFLLSGISNVANTASNFLNGVVQRQKELLHHVTDTATDYGIIHVKTLNSTRDTRQCRGEAEELADEYGNNDNKLYAASIGLDFKLRRLLEKFRSRMPYGFPELGVPILEPLQLNEIYLETHSTEIGDIEIFVDDVTITGLSAFIVDRARLSLIGPTIAVNLTIPTVHVDGYYNISGILGDMIRVRGAGPFTATAHDLRIFFETVLGYSRGMYMKSFELDFSIRAVNIRLENFMGGGKYGNIMNNVFEELTPKAIEIIKPEILPDIQDYICARVNETIYHLTMRDVLIFLIGENEVQNNPHLLQP